MVKKGIIRDIRGREILNSRGEPTVGVKLFTDFGVFQASTPSGASKGKSEAKELRDGGKRYFGRGVLKAVENINGIIAKELKGKSVLDQGKIDRVLIELDGTEDKSRLGANAILPVSIAAARAAATLENIPLYQYIANISSIPFEKKLPLAAFNIINGGAHAGNDLDIQEFMIVPQRKIFRENLLIASEIYHSLKTILEKTFGKSAINLGDEGGFAPPLSKTKEALEFLEKAKREASFSKDVKLGMDCAASHFFKGREYRIEKSSLTSFGLFSFYKNLLEEFPLIFLEDPFSQDDWAAFETMVKRLKKKIIIFGDDLTTTNPSRIKKAIEKKACTGVIIKPNQIGTITETLEAVRIAKKSHLKLMVSHRSGDTCDDFIADLAVGIGADFIKSGAPARGERVAKYNRLLEIEEELLNQWKKR